MRSLSPSASLQGKSESTAVQPAGTWLLGLSVLPLLAVVVVFSWYEMANDTSQPKTASAGEERVLLSDGAKRRLQADVADFSVGTDVATMRTYQKVLTDQSEDTNKKLRKLPHDETLVKRKVLIELSLTNPGRTGVNDRLAAVEKALQMVASGAVYMDEDEATVRRAMTNLHSSSTSWKTGAFANTGRYLGLNWEEGKGLTVSAPYIWAKTGWEPEPVSQIADKQDQRGVRSGSQ